MLTSNYILLSGICSFLIFCWQHLARKHGWTWKPSYILDLVTNQLVKVWTFLGKVCVWISSFYTWIDPTDLLATLNELFSSIWKFLFSWLEFFKAYVANMKLYDHSYLISFGSATLVGLLSYVIWINFEWSHKVALLIIQPTMNFFIPIQKN